MHDLYKIDKKDSKRCVNTLTDAFKDDPDKDKALTSFFTIPILYGIKFGKIYATSERIEGVAVWEMVRHPTIAVLA